MFASALCAQQSQTGAPVTWPCVPGRAVDPSYLEVSESTGGQLFLFQKGEVEHASVVMNASRTHPATIIRAVGHLSGSREFEFPVDSKTASILLTASLQCRSAIVLTRPNGAEMTAYNSVRNIDLKAGRIVQVDAPEPGKWKVRLAGTGLFVLSVTGKTEIGIGSVSFLEGDQRRSGPARGIHQELEVHVSGEVATLGFHLVGPAGEFIAGLEPPDHLGGALLGPSWLLERIDRGHVRYGIQNGIHLELKPSEYFHRQCYVNFWFEEVGIKMREYIGVDHIMWESDYPHPTCTYPDSQQYIARVTQELSPEERQKILVDNAVRVFNLDT